MSYKRQNKRYTVLVLFSFVFSLMFFGQAPLQTENPYSRYGLGELEQKGFAPAAGMAKSWTAFENDTTTFPNFINSSNPASYSSLALTSFEVGGKSNFNRLSTADQKTFKNNTYLSYISLGFPLGKRTGMAFGINPYSTVGYQIVDKYSVANIGDMKTQYTGSGGINEVFLGAGIKPFKLAYYHFRKSHRYTELAGAGQWKKIRKKRVLKTTLSSFALGANGYFLFGDLDQTTEVIYPSNVTFFSTRRIRNTRISDFYSSFGAMFSIKIDSTLNKRRCEIPDTSSSTGYRIEYRNDCPCKNTMTAEEYEKQFPKKYWKRHKKETKITFGATAYLPTQLASKYTALAYSYKKYSSTQDLYFDTTLNVTKTGNITMPLILRYGIAVKRGSSLTFTTDVSLQNWSYYRYFGENPRLKNSMRYAAGFQYINNAELKTEKEILKKKTFWRGGLYYEESYLDLKNTRINSYGLTFGVGIPLGKKIINHINVSSEFGMWGTKSNGLIENKYARLTIGFSLNDRWFVKRVID